MKICLWSSSSFEQWYSSYHLMLKLIIEILDAGHELWLVQYQWSTGIIPEEIRERENLHVINVPQRQIEKGSFIKRYISAVKYFFVSSKKVKEIGKIDVIFLQSNNCAAIPVRFAKKNNIPIVYNVQDIFPMDAMVIGKISERNPIYSITRSMQKYAYINADYVITISEDLAQTIRGEGRDNIEVIYNWSYQNQPYNIMDENNHFLISNKITRDDGFRVVYAGNVGQMIEIEMIIQVALKLKMYEDIKIFIIGEGSALNKLKKRVEEENINNIIFFGRQPMEYAQDNYCMADVNINPVPKGVMYTCMPSKTATCLLSEKPTVVSMDLDSDMAKKLSEVDQWFVVKPGDSNAMAEAIIKIYKTGSRKSKNSAKFLQDLGPIENARKYVKVIEKAGVIQ